MLKKDEVSKYTISKNAYDMLEWPPYSSKYTAKDIPQLIKKSFKPMTNSTNHLYQSNGDGEGADAAHLKKEEEIDYLAPETTHPQGFQPPAVPGTEVTQTPGLIPETPTNIPGYDPSTASAPGEYIPDVAPVADHMTNDPYYDQGDPDGGVNTTEGYVPADTSGVGGAEADHQIGVDDAYASAYPAGINPDMPEHPDPDEAHHQLMSDPHYAVHVHESQLGRIVEVLEEIASKLNDLEYRLESLESSVRFDQEHHDGPPEPPSGTDYTITGDHEPTT